jgi:hypothetical protein
MPALAQIRLSADDPARWALGAADWLVAALFRIPSVARYASAALTSFHVIHPCNSLFGCPRNHRTEVVGATTNDAPGRVYAVTLRVAEALAALASQRALWSHVQLHRHSQTAEFGDRSHLGHLEPSRH